MPHYPSKKQKLEGLLGHPVADGNDFLVSFGDLGVDLLANVLGFLTPKDVMSKRSINKKTMEAVKRTIPPDDFCVNRMRDYNVMNVMTRAMPNLQQITIGGLRVPNKWCDGEDPNEEGAARTADYKRSHNIGIIPNFSKLRVLKISFAGLNGRYPVLFNSFPLLQKLSIQHCEYLKYDLGMLGGFPLLKEFYSDSNDHLTGNINSLRVLRDTLELVEIRATWRNFTSSRVEGNFMDLADFPHLKKLNLGETAVTGDIRDIDDKDFPSLEELVLPKGVYGGRGYELQRISDAPDLMRAVYLLKKRRPSLKMNRDWCAYLSRDSPDWYQAADDDTNMSPPFRVCFVEAGSRIGYRWEGGYDSVCPPCEVNWLDPEPESDSREYEDYLADYQRIQRQISLYRGHYEPPTEEQYIILYEEVRFQSDDEDHWDYE